MTKIQVYSIWHKQLYDELYEDISQEELQNIVMYGVNEGYQKVYTPNKYNILLEYDLPLYNAVLQEHNYCQTTCMWHLWKNKEVTYRRPGHELDWIGFMQYDMKPDAQMFADMRKRIEDAVRDNKQVIFHEQTEHILQSVQWASGLALPYEGSALQHYNQFFRTNFTMYDFIHNHRLHKVPIVHTFVISVAMFEKMMAWIESYMEMLEAMYPAYPSNKSQCELLERCHGMFLALECANGGVEMHPMKVKHIWPLYHDKTEWKNYKTIV